MLTTYTGALASHPGWGPAYGGGPGWWVVFPILWFLLAAAVVFFVIRRTRRGWVPPGWRHGTGPDPVAVLGERYARGEIDEAEYRTRLQVLRPEARER
ncbi:hypothetical protein DNL40_07305 [Xylanimonas oleitrophica]|uniref:SHOCT domain-containing protein n=1 Tax=Xylanimonas oleitrophica TaxID=2607479 RepID=A0A2W5WYZ0_9MICO|nr:SHOCT domain-containing protein [Xylanimonas oleitrophica]PZR53556.1 hypothetical protein DNL40_07305 [Xylanimonas oleitrophica]